LSHLIKNTQPESFHGLGIVEIYMSHTETHNMSHFMGLLEIDVSHRGTLKHTI